MTKTKEMSLLKSACVRCNTVFREDQRIVNSSGELWCEQCFVCAQCFRPFPDGVFFEFDGRKYCEHDFNVLFAPCCGKCNEFVIGRVIKALNNSWHPQCFLCQLCNCELADTGFMKNRGRALCHPCHLKEKAASTGKYICYRCHGVIEEDMLIKYKKEPHHAYHFNCTRCSEELNGTARELRGELYCLPCHDKMGIPICQACHRPIDERIVTALGKHWHVEHFVCARCEKPFLGHKHYEKNGKAYCETHYNQLFGNICFYCNKAITSEMMCTMSKTWCDEHFFCMGCDTLLTTKSKFIEFDLKPVCKRCYDRFPNELKRRLKKTEMAGKKFGKNEK
ncbi:LIM and senescent cell antigen-like-containing domain protein 1 [Lytechinus variegatus]|uniref:LIM and senescent cell antigen-like-containing domain protein 1 n=1 Tax=Lytechinus variegatus TaxID=7654 RepID=UPI001BB28BD4|nr:LIM and senescent cell antigen-like-containing domain protein 1 [Lytechinus variegatus]